MPVLTKKALPKPISNFWFIIPLKPISWNVLARKNHWLYTKVFNEWKQATWAAVKEAKLEKCRFSTPALIVIICRWKQRRRHDIDSIVAKPVIDALVGMGILEDDSLEYVFEVRYEGQTGAKADEMEVHLVPSV